MILRSVVCVATKFTLLISSCYVRIDLGSQSGLVDIGTNISIILLCGCLYLWPQGVIKNMNLWI